MDSEVSPNLAGNQAQALLPWHKPKIQRLVVKLDTGNGPGSGPDLETNGLNFFSDLRLKQDISGISNALAGVLALNGVTYRYNTSRYPELGLSDQPQIGFLAQDLEQVYPELVVTRKDGFKAVNYAQLVPVMVEAIKQQQAMIEDLRAEVAELRPSSRAR